jgi:hypothetical protein
MLVPIKLRWHTHTVNGDVLKTVYNFYNERDYRDIYAKVYEYIPDTFSIEIVISDYPQVYEEFKTAEAAKAKVEQLINQYYNDVPNN